MTQYIAYLAIAFCLAMTFLSVIGIFRAAYKRRPTCLPLWNAIFGLLLAMFFAWLGGV